MPKIYTNTAHCRTRCPPRAAAALVLWMFSLSLLLPTPFSASSWNPTLLVNTEAFQIVHEGDSAAGTNVELRFGDILGEKIYWDRTNSEFRFTDDIRTDGNITASGSLVVNTASRIKANLQVAGTMSGAILYASSGINSSGAVIIKTPVTTTTSLAGTGALVVMQRVEYGTGAYIYASGAAILALDSPVQGQRASNTPHIAFGYKGNFDTNLYRQTGSRLRTDDSLWVGQTISGSSLNVTGNITTAGTIFNALPLSTVEGRLTLTSGRPVTTADVTAESNVFFAPYKGDRIYLYDGTRWKLYTFNELSLALGTVTSGLPYDVFIYDNAGTLTLEKVAWTNGTTRATALGTTNGVLLKSGDSTRRYLGTFYTTSTTTTEDSAAKRFLWNYYNRVPRKLFVNPSDASHTYATASWRSWNNSTANRVEVVIGFSETLVDLFARGLCSMPGTSEYGVVGIAVDGTATNDADIVDTSISGPASSFAPAFAQLRHYPDPGYHYYQMTEYASTTTNITFYGTFSDITLRRNGILGSVEG
ncbi:polymer-forming cytoskeletal protein [Candidatus Peregrinibacteria bacterium]|nr:polymer-forming cytoskeletal protein [Candidatus Peregrinibacteria bacterium]